MANLSNQDWINFLLRDVKICLQPLGTAITSAVSASSGHQQTCEIGKTNDLVFFLEHHSQFTDAERYRLPTSNGPKNAAVLDTDRQSCCKFLNIWLEDDRSSNWLVYTQLASGGGSCEIYALWRQHV